MFLLLSSFRLAGNPELPKIKFSAPEERAEIKDTGRVLELKAGKRKLAPASAASRLAVPGRIYRWTPSVLISRATGGADLYSVDLTCDGSAVIFAERTGETGNAHGLRLIVCETESGKIVRAGKVFPVRPVSSKVLEDDTLLILANPASDDSTNCFFAAIDMVKEKMTVRKELAQTPVAAALSDEFAALLNGDGSFEIYSVDDFSRIAAKKLGEGFSGVTFSNDGKNVAVYGKNRILIFNTSTLYRRAEYKLDGADFTRCTVPGRKGFENAVFYSIGGDACVLQNHNLIKLEITPGGTAVSDLKTGRVIIENRIRELEIFQFPDLVPAAKYAPGIMRPLSRNEIFSLHFTAGKEPRFLMVDHRGNLWKIEFKGKRGRKSALLIVDKTGVRQSK